MLKNEKGITLIALIITIIVMLILVGVTINVALNGGLFQKAEQATRETEEKAILEEMIAMMVIYDNGKFKPDEIIANMIAKHPEYEIDDSNKPNITITGKLGTYNYIVSETEIKIGSIKNEIVEPITGKAYGLNENNCIIVTDNGRLVVIVKGQILKEWEYEIYEGDLKNHQEYASIASAVDYSAFNKFAITDEFGYFYAFSNNDNTLSICYLNPAPDVFSTNLQSNDSINISSILSEL